MQDDRESLKGREDKNIFGIMETQEIARSIGFRHTFYQNIYHPTNYGEIAKRRIIQALKPLNFDLDKLESYNFLFENYENYYTSTLGAYVPLHFSFFIFRK